MNKKEALKKIEKLEGLNIKDKDFNFDIEMIPKGDVLEFIEQIDEPEKPVVPKYVAEWLEYCKSNKLTFLGAFHPVSEHGIRLANTFTGGKWKGIDWAKRNQDTFARAWLDGYEVEKEKLYTAMLKISGEYLRLDCEGNFGHFKVDLKYFLDGTRAYQFTEDDLVKYHIWGNDNYEVKEVEE